MNWYVRLACFTKLDSYHLTHSFFDNCLTLSTPGLFYLLVSYSYLTLTLEMDIALRSQPRTPSSARLFHNSLSSTQRSRLLNPHLIVPPLRSTPTPSSNTRAQYDSTVQNAARRFSASARRTDFHFDTHHFVQRLEREGLNRAQAEGIMSAIAEVIDESIRNMTSNMVTKADQEKVLYMLIHFDCSSDHSSNRDHTYTYSTITLNKSTLRSLSQSFSSWNRMILRSLKRRTIVL